MYYTPLTLKTFQKFLNDLSKDKPPKEISIPMGVCSAYAFEAYMDAIAFNVRIAHVFFPKRKPYPQIYLSLFEKHGKYKVLVDGSRATFRYIVFEGTREIFQTNSFREIQRLNETT